MKKFQVAVILDEIRSSHNVGSVFRTADALGLAENGKIYLAGYTPAPEDKFKRENKEISKVALGAQKTVAWEKVKTTAEAIKKLRAEGFNIVAVEQSPRSVDYKKFKIAGPTTFIFGNEVDGVSEKILALCDEVIEIPMKGKKESLNVSVAFGISLARALHL